MSHTIPPQSVKSLLHADASVGESVRVQGWLRSKRDSKAGISFLAIHDGSCFDTIQAVVPADLDNYESEVKKLSTGCSVDVIGILVQSEGKGQALEIQATQVEVVGTVDDPEGYPIAKKRHTFEYLRTQAHLRPRTNTFGAITRVRTTLANAIHQFFFDHGFHWINTPIITGSDCEGAGELFRVSTLDLVNTPRTPDGKIDFGQDFFEQEAFLTVSGQLEVESYCLAMSKVYTFGPTFRAENSNTSRHLAEFWMVEPELAFADLQDDMDCAEAYLKHCLTHVLEHCDEDLEFFEKNISKDNLRERLRGVATSDFARITYTEAVDHVLKAKKKFEFPVEWGCDLQSEHERYLTEEVFKNRPVIVRDYPKAVKAFYMRENDDGKTVAAMDVLVPKVGELMGGSQREERLDVLERRIEEVGLEKESYWWYLDLRRYGSVPHAGFGLGFERLVQYVTGVENIRDVIPFPRYPGSAEF